MSKRSKSKKNAKDKPELNLKRGIILAIIGFIPLAAIWIYVNRHEPIGGTLISLAVAAMGAALGLFLVYRLNRKK